MLYKGKKAICTFRPPEKAHQRRLVWEVTDLCNMRCSHCCNNATRVAGRGKMNTRWMSLAQELPGAHVCEVYISGGEPLILDDLPDLLRVLVQCGISTVVASNGLLVPLRLQEIPQDIPLLISLDSPDALEHDIIRGYPGAYAGAIDAMQVLRAAGRPFHVGTVLHDGLLSNITKLKQIVSLAYEYSANGIVFSRVIAVGRAREANVHEISPEVTQLIDQLASAYAGRLWVSHPRISWKEDAPLGECIGGRNLFHIASTGEVAPCSYGAKLRSWTFGNVHISDLASVISSNACQQFVDSTRAWARSQDEFCCNCAHLKSCGRGCPLFGVDVGYCEVDAECYAMSKALP